MDDPGYLSDPSQVALLPGSAAAVARLNRADIPVAVISNQSGIGRGFFGWPEFERVQDELERQLAAQRAQLDMVLACGHHGDPPHPWRKPGTGMLLAAARELGLDLTRSWLVGDRATDIDAARAAGLRGAVLVATGLGRETAASVDVATHWSGFEVHYDADLAAAVDRIVRQLDDGLSD